MLIDEFLPEYDFNEVHDIRIDADTRRVYRGLGEADLAESWIVRWLFRLRGLPAENVTLKSLKKIGFETLGEIENKELLLGLAGRFWRITGDLKKIDAPSFKAFDERGYAKAVWNFSIDPFADGTKLRTETRIKCLDEESRTRFRRYWMVIGPFSGLIRSEMLRTIKRSAEAV